MHRKSLTRWLAAVALSGAAVLCGGGAASAGQPSWSMNVENLPTAVAAGSDAGYQITITNGGPSNIASLTLDADTDVAVDYIAPSQGSCSELPCSLGALRKGQTATVVVAFPTEAGDTSFTAGFFASSNGVTGSDKGHNSHGDFLRPTVPEASTTLKNDPDFAGGFVVGDHPIVTAGGATSSQTTSVAPPVTHVIATIDQGDDVNGPDSPFACPASHTCFGKWAKVTVGAGQTFPDGSGGNLLFPVTLTVPVPPISVVKVAHVLDGGSTEILSTRCVSGQDPTRNCITVKPVPGGKIVITAWVDQNGGFKGMG